MLFIFFSWVHLKSKSYGAVPSQKLNNSLLKNIPGNYYVYAALDKDNNIAVYKLDSITGNLIFIEKEITPGRVGSLAVSHSKKYLYAAIRSTHQVSSFQIVHSTGKLRHIQNTMVADNPVYISVDKTNKHLFTAYYNAGRLAIYPLVGDSIISKSGVLNQIIGIQPHYIHTDPQNKFLYVPLKGSDQILQYSFDVNSGKPDALNPAFVSTITGAGPRHLDFHPNLDFVYVANELNNTISQYRFNKTTGQLKLRNSLSTLPYDFRDKNKVADIHITPNGKYVYVSNRGHNSIAAFKIAQATGDIMEIGQYKTEPNPREFDISPDGKYLLAGGEDSGNIIIYKINEDGSLIELNIFQAGSSVTWILCVFIPK
jgi:6-phosphogluconolactonase